MYDFQSKTSIAIPINSIGGLFLIAGGDYYIPKEFPREFSKYENNF